MLLKIVLIIILLTLTMFFINKSFKEKLYIKRKGINSFDKVMYINLSHREDRKKQILNELKKIGVKENKIIRVDAVHNKLNGHIGCAKSHIKTLELAKKMNLNSVIVLEDDFIFTTSKKDVKKLINSFLKKFENNWDVIQLTTVWKNLSDIKNNNFIKKVNSATTSSGYIIHKNFYDTVINNLKDALSKMENEMVEWKKKKSW